jgi:hypothetical protein
MPKTPSADAASTDSGGVKPAPSTNTPAASKPIERAQPQVIVFNEQEYMCQPNDTFESLSKRFFNGSDKYAAALQRHNQNHARASDLMARSGKITPGERIFIPPADILEQRYPDAIERSKVPSTTGTMPASFNAPAGTPVPPSLSPGAADGASQLKPVPSLPPAPPPPPSAPPSGPPSNFVPPSGR